MCILLFTCALALFVNDLDVSFRTDLAGASRSGCAVYLDLKFIKQQRLLCARLPARCLASCLSPDLPCLLQADSMSSNKDMAQKYKSAADYEDDFM